MTDLRRLLEHVEIPDEDEARARAWDVVSRAFVEREPSVRRRLPVKPLVAAAAAAALVAAVLSPPGEALLDSVREAIGVEDAEPELFRLPDGGSLLVESEEGPWVVQRDGSKRLLGRYEQASWSPTGLYVVATRRNELVTLEPDGDVHWKLSRPNVRLPRWGGTRVDTRIAYFTGPPLALRVVAGDGDPDRFLASDPHSVAPAWRPGRSHVLALADRDGRIWIFGTDRRSSIGRSAVGELPIQLAWSPDGKRLVALGRRSLRILDLPRRRWRVLPAPRGARNVVLAFAPRRHAYALIRRTRTGSEVVLSDGRRVFSGTGSFTDLAWSPDGKWLLVGWRDADQWVFVRLSGKRKILAVSGISRQFESSRFPRVVGWCCPAR